MELNGAYISSNDDVPDRDKSHGDWLILEVDGHGASPSG